MDSIFFFFWFCWFCWWCLFAAEKMDYDQEGGGVVIIVLASLKGGNRTTAERIANHMVKLIFISIFSTLLNQKPKQTKQKQIDGAIVELKDTNSALLTRESLSKDIQYYGFLSFSPLSSLFPVLKIFFLILSPSFPSNSQQPKQKSSWCWVTCPPLWSFFS